MTTSKPDVARVSNDVFSAGGAHRASSAYMAGNVTPCDDDAETRATPHACLLTYFHEPLENAEDDEGGAALGGHGRQQGEQRRAHHTDPEHPLAAIARGKPAARDLRHNVPEVEGAENVPCVSKVC